MNPANSHGRTARLLLLILLAVPLGLAQTSSIRVDGEIIKGYIAEMASADRLGRKSLTPGYEETADWAAARFKDWGLQPAGENGTYFQSVPIRGDRASFAWTLGTPELVINGRAFYTKDSDFMVDYTSTPGARIDAEVIFVGYGISAPAKGLDEYAVDVKGKVVLALKGSPHSAPAGRGMFGPGPAPAPERPEAAQDPWADESADTVKAQLAYDRGAAAILLYDPAAPAAGGPPGMPQRREVAPSPFSRPFIHVSGIDERAFRRIMSPDPQETARGFGVRLDQIRRDIKDKKVQSAATGARAQIKAFDSVTLYGEKFNRNISRNVLARIEGTDPELKSQYVIVGGHLDHLGVINGVVYNGADDNASGSAVTMEVARLLAAHKFQPKRTVIFGLWCGEEMGLLGSRHYVATPSDGVSMDRTVAYFNMDMVGLGTEIGAPGALNFPEIFEVIMRDQAPEVAKIVRPRTGGPGGSDHSAFIELGIEALALMTGGGVGHPDYHDAADDLEKIDPDILGKTGQFVLQGVVNLAGETSQNLLIADRQHLYNGMRMNIPNVTGSGSGWELLKASTNAELMQAINERVSALQRSLQEQRPAAGRRFRAQASSRVGRGIRDAGIFEGNAPLVEAAAALLEFGRVDVVRADGAWFGDRVSDQGQAALKLMEANNIAVNLVNPSPSLLADMLDVAARPFMVTVTGSTMPDAALIARMNEKNTVLAVDCSPADVPGCVARLESARKQFNDTDNLLLTMNASGNIDDAKKSLYLALVKNGWSKDQVYAMTGVNLNGRPGGNLSRFMPQTEPER